MSRLWLGGDHLLHVTSTGYTESYRRCYLRDIQTMLIVHTARRTYLALTLTVFLIIIAVIMRAWDSGLAGYLILATVFIPFFLWNHLLGEGCRVVVITAVQQGKRVLLSAACQRPGGSSPELKPLIEAAQADFGAAQTVLPPVIMPVASGSHLPPPLPPS